jgi:hypothetical protein
MSPRGQKISSKQGMGLKLQKVVKEVGVRQKKWGERRKSGKVQEVDYSTSNHTSCPNEKQPPFCTSHSHFLLSLFRSH